jgi:DNA-binding transcriptional LysR family regulator
MQEAHLFELRHLRAFAAVAEGGGVAHAASRLARSQPAITRQLQDLETLLGVALFDRGGRSLALTDAGRALLDDARALLAAADAFAARAGAVADGRVGRLTIGFGGAAINSVLGPALGAFRAAQPDVELRLVEHFDDLELSAMVQRRALDAAIVRFATESPELRRVAIGVQPYRAALAADHPLAGAERISLSELADEPFLLWPRSAAPAAWDAVLRACGDAGFTPRVAQEAVSVPTLLALAAAGLGVALIAEGYAALARADVRFLPLRDGPVAGLDLVTRAGEPDPPALARLRALLYARSATPTMSSAGTGRPKR